MPSSARQQTPRASITSASVAMPVERIRCTSRRARAATAAAHWNELAGAEFDDRQPPAYRSGNWHCGRPNGEDRKSMPQVAQCMQIVVAVEVEGEVSQHLQLTVVTTEIALLVGGFGGTGGGERPRGRRSGT